MYRLMFFLFFYITIDLNIGKLNSLPSLTQHTPPFLSPHTSNELPVVACSGGQVGNGARQQLEVTGHHVHLTALHPLQVRLPLLDGVLLHHSHPVLLQLFQQIIVFLLLSFPLSFQFFTSFLFAALGLGNILAAGYISWSGSSV